MAKVYPFNVSERSQLMNGIKLTRAQRRVVDLTLAGKPPAQVARILKRSHFTIRNHLKTVYDKYGVSNCSELIIVITRKRKPRHHGPYQNLTPGQRRVIDLLAEGLPPARIARDLGLSPYTVFHHIRGAREIYGVRTRAQLLSKIFGVFRSD